MMYSSGDRVREPGPNYPTQWALNPSAYQNVSNENVDWAALAQQWIMMKETASEPPGVKKEPKESLNEGGEAPMDVETEKDEANEPYPDDAPWNWQQYHWPPNWNGPLAAAVGTPAVPLTKSALLPTPFTQYAAPSAESNNSTAADFSIASTGSEYVDASSVPEYWTSGAARGKHPAKAGRPFRKGPPFDARLESTEVTLDAAKRKQLPAWIREGLEKMEREKQKQQDRERERLEREEYITRKREESKSALEILRPKDGTGTVTQPKSKFESDSADTDEEASATNSNSNNIKRKNHQDNSGVLSRSDSSPISLTEENKMMMVRRAMTEILLQVTSTEIEAICEEELNRFRLRTAGAKKGSRPAASGASAPAAGALGLGIYGGGSSSNSDVEYGSDASNGIPGVSSNHIQTEQRHQPVIDNGNPGSVRRQQFPSQLKEKSKQKPVAELGRTGLEKNGGGDSQVDTTRSHGNVSRKQRRGSNSSSSSSSSSSKSSQSSSKSTSSSETESGGEKQKRLSKRSSSSSQSSSGSKESSDSDKNKSSKRNRSPSGDKRRSSANNTGTKRRSKYSHSSSVDSTKNFTNQRPLESSSTSRILNRSVSRRERSRSHSRRSTTSRQSHTRSHRSRSRDTESKSCSQRLKSPNRSSRSRDHRSKSYNLQSRSLDRRARSRDRRSRSRNRRSRSRDHRSRSRSRRSRSRNNLRLRRRSRSRERLRDYRGRRRTRSRSGGGKRTRGH